MPLGVNFQDIFEMTRRKFTELITRFYIPLIISLIALTVRLNLRANSF